MRTKTSILCAVLVAAGVATSMAQTYSQNIVGYVNVVHPPGFRIITNPLNATNNDVTLLIPNPPDGTTVYKRAGGGYLSTTFDSGLGGWGGDTVVLNPGEAAFLQNTTGSPFTNTYVGDAVLNSTNPIPSGYSLRGSALPQSAPIQATLNYPPTDGDTIYFFNPSGGYNAFDYDSGLGGWYNGEPSPAVGQGFWVYNSGSAKSWIRNFIP